MTGMKYVFKIGLASIFGLLLLAPGLLQAQHTEKVTGDTPTAAVPETMPPKEFMTAPTMLPDHGYVDPYKEYRNLSDAEVTRRFSQTFLEINPLRCHFTNNQGHTHNGYDVNCLPLNTPFPVTVKLPLVITETSHDPLYGNYITARDLTGRFTFIFAHLSEIYVKVGDISDPDTPMFKTGTTGNSSGVHLHFEILKEGFPTQLDDAVYERFKTIYKKEERTPLEVLTRKLNWNSEKVNIEILDFISNRFYPLDWYRLIAVSRYEETTLFGLIQKMQAGNVTDYYQFATYFDRIKKITDKKERTQALTVIRSYLRPMLSEQFIVDPEKEAAAAEAEKAFKEANPADYPVKKK